MSKWYGEIGFSENTETSPGVWVPKIKKRYYYGDILRNSRRYAGSDTIEDRLTISNQISILADPYALDSFYNMVYATFMNTKWKITNIEVSYPRLILTLGSEFVEGSSSDV